MFYAAFHGRLISMVEPVYIFDLDETILSVNSFPRWVVYLVRGKFGGLSPFARLRLSLTTAIILAARKAHLCNHIAAKQRFQTLWSEAISHDPQQEALTTFINTLTKTIRPVMQDALNLTKQDAVLATAAAGEYAYALGQTLGFKHVIATKSRAEGFGAENVRTQKRDNVLAFLEQQGWQNRPRIFFTDHHEDLPLIKVSQRVFWFGKDEDVATLSVEAPGVEIIPCLNRVTLSGLLKSLP